MFHVVIVRWLCIRWHAGYVNMLGSEYLRSLSVWSCHSAVSPFFVTSFWKFGFNKISVFC